MELEPLNATVRGAFPLNAAGEIMATGGSGGAVAVTVTACWLVAPVELVTVRMVWYVPGEENVWLSWLPLPELLSPKLQP